MAGNSGTAPSPDRRHYAEVVDSIGDYCFLQAVEAGTAAEAANQEDERLHYERMRAAWQQATMFVMQFNVIFALDGDGGQ